MAMAQEQNPKRRLSFVDSWAQQRKGGVFYAIFLIGSCTMVLLLFLQLIYQIVIRDFSAFPFHPLFLVAAVGAGLAYWFINEARYKKLLAKKEAEEKAARAARKAAARSEKKD